MVLPTVWKNPGDESVVTAGDISDALEKYIIVDKGSKLASPVLGEIDLQPEFTFDFSVDKDTGQPPSFTDSLVAGDGTNNKIQSTWTHLPIDVKDILCRDVSALIVDGGVFKPGTANGLMNVTGGGFLDSHCEMAGVVTAQQNLGKFTNTRVGLSNCTEFSWENPLQLNNVTSANINNLVITENAASSGAMIVIEGDSGNLNFTGGLYQPTAGQWIFDILPSIGEDARIHISGLSFSKLKGGEFFGPAEGGNLIAAVDNSETDTILSFADQGGGVTLVTSTNPLPASVVDGRKVTFSGTSNDGTHAIFNRLASSFEVASVITGTGSWTFNSVLFQTQFPHLQPNGTSLQVSKSFEQYNKCRFIFGVTGSTFSMDDIIFQGDATGKWANRLNQEDPRINVVDNGDDQSDSTQLLSSEINVTEVVTINTIGVFEDITSWVPVKDKRFTFNAPGEDVGSVRFDGPDGIHNHSVPITVKMITGGPSPNTPRNIEVELVRKAAGPGPYTRIGQSFLLRPTVNAVDSTTVIVNMVDTMKGDVFKIRANNLTDTDNVEIIQASDSAFEVTRGL